MKRTFRFATFVLLVGGWALAASALHVVRTPGHLIVIPKDRIGFHDTYVDARRWTLTDVSMHADVAARLIHLGRGDLIAYAAPHSADPQAQLVAAVEHPIAPPSTPSPALEKLKANMMAAAHAVKSVFD